MSIAPLHAPKFAMSDANAFCKRTFASKRFASPPKSQKTENILPSDLFFICQPGTVDLP